MVPRLRQAQDLSDGASESGWAGSEHHSPGFLNSLDRRELGGTRAGVSPGSCPLLFLCHRVEGESEAGAGPAGG